MSTNAIFLTITGFFLGSLMWSYWLGRLVLKRDIRELGDGNPGAFNLMKTGKMTVAGLGLMLDIGKGVIPIGLAMTLLPVTGWEIVPVAIASILGHAFSPWMNFKGGKAVAVTGGMLIGLQPDFTLLIGMPIFVLSYLVVNLSGWALALTMILLTGLVILLRPSPPVIAIHVISALILLFKYRADLRQRPGLRHRSQ